MRYTVDIEVAEFEISVGMKEYVKSSSIPVLRKKAIVLLNKKLKELEYVNG